MRKAIEKQLRFVARNLRSVAALAGTGTLSALPRSLYKKLLVIQELYRQQRQMFDERSHSVPDRIVSISQPHVRPIVRGKAKASVEFGAKVAIGLVNGFAFEEKLDWDNFYEGLTLKASVEAYYKRFGFYPEAVLADQICRNRENLRYCKGLGIRLSRQQLWRPSANQDEAKRLSKLDASERNAIEGKFGEGKRCYGLGRVRARLQATSETVISLQFLVMNLERRLRLFFFSSLAWLQAFRLCLNVRLLQSN